MTDSHLRASIRVALAARGLEFSQADYHAASTGQWRNGVQVREEILAASMAAADISRLREVEPEFWDRIPLIADLGFRQTSLFQSLLSAETEWASAAALLGAAFNLAITLIDYSLDELGAGGRLFRFLDASLIRNIFAAPAEAESELEIAAHESQDVRERALWGLIGFCASSGRSLLLATANQAAWEDLGNTIALLLEGETEVSMATWPSDAEAHRLLPYMEAKSCLPSVAALHIARLANRPAAIMSGPDLTGTARRLGAVFWRTDELVDLLHDLRSGTPNIVLLKLADRLALEDRHYASDKDIYDEVDASVEELAPLLGLAPALECAEEAPAVFRFARLVVAGWTRWIATREFHRRSDAEGSSCRPLDNGLAFLLARQAEGYREAIHHLHFPRLLNEGVRYETRPSILSHRAVILDALLDATEAGLDYPLRVLASESMAILRAKHRDARGGWSYIQEAPELPPDADDLGQVLQVLARFGGCDLASICDEAIRIVLDSSEEDGSFCTWILDPTGHSFADERMRSYLSVMGGWGIHPEVVANFLYGLCLYDPDRYREPLRRSVRYLEKVQNPDGSWSSKWYCGPFYGTWRAASVLGRLAPASDALIRAQRFLLARRHANGGWGEGSPEALSTALAMLALCADGIETDAAALSAGSAFLSQTQQSDGGWPSCPWICFPTIDSMVIHGSACVTTAFSLKALLAAEQILGRSPNP